MRTPLNTVNMGITLFSFELESIRDAVEQLGVGLGRGIEQGEGMEEGQSGAQQASALELAQKFLLEKVDALKTIAIDVTTSTDAAVDVLNDLLNYDKVCVCVCVSVCMCMYVHYIHF
jgi:hypothetical protein